MILARIAPVLAAATLAAACATDGIIASPVPAVMETAPMTGTGDKADDPAVWFNAANPARSLILGTNKDEGLYVYDLAGAELQRIPVGLVNNVDLRGEVAVASNDQVNGLSWFRIDPATLSVAHLGDTKVQRIEPYGLCSGVISGVYMVAVTYKDGAIEFWSARTPPGQPVSTTLERTVQLKTQLEGCVFDDDNNRIFIGEEAHGVWSLDLASSDAVPVEVDTIAARRGLAADVEGMSLWRGPGSEGYLVVSAQQRDRFVIYDRAAPHAVRGVITVAASADGAIDAVTHTDGLDISSDPLPGFPSGVLVVQDDGNPRSGVDQNFKLVDWRAVVAALGLGATR